MNFIKKIISTFYNDAIESMCVRLLYFFNTIDTYFLIAGIGTFIVCYKQDISPLFFLFGFCVAVATAKISDFYPYFIIPGIIAIVGLFYWLHLDLTYVAILFGTNVLACIIIQFGFMGIPDSIVARDPKVAFLKLYNSIFTVAPTTVSLSMSVFFSFYLAFLLSVFVEADSSEWWGVGLATVVLFIGAFVTRLMLPKNHFSKFHKPDLTDARFKRVLILNIDGCRKDIFDSLELPAMERLKKNGAYHRNGLTTVYRALTNSAFASIFTGTIPKIHGVKDNNFGQSIRTEGILDVVPSIAYGSMHVEHFCKDSWTTKVVSLPMHSVYKSDAVAVEWLKEDILRDEERLFILDFSEADFLGHAYGSTSDNYKKAIQKIDGHVGNLLDWLTDNGLADDTATIICSDHGMAAIDHSYLLAKSEMYVPFIISGKGIKNGYVIERPGSIMDICNTTAYLLGVPYPKDARGQVFTDVLDDCDYKGETEEFVRRFNCIKYGLESPGYIKNHPEIYEGDITWWDNFFNQYKDALNQEIRILDIGCGTGFIAERVRDKNFKNLQFVGQDISKEMLDVARKSVENDKRFLFVTNLDEIEGLFDVICASSVFHHTSKPEDISRVVNRLLAPGGVVVGSHEPNRRPFQNPLFRIFASFYKQIGGGLSISHEFVKNFNTILKHQYPLAPRVCEEEILQMVEFHSPVEQYLDSVDPTVGFVPEEFVATHFKGYEIIVLENYTTFFHRPFLQGKKKTQAILHGIYQFLFQDGNLFRFVLKKPKNLIENQP